MSAIVLCDDLIFSSRITGTAKALGLSIKPAGSVAKLQEFAKQAPPTCVIVDLATPGLQIEELLDWLKTNCPAPPRVVAYGSHVDVATLTRAREAGCEPVLPRSKFVEELPAQLPAWLAS